MSAASNFHPSREAGLESLALLQAQELRPVIVEVPDRNSPEFEAEIRRQTLALANSEQEKDDLAFIDSISTLAWPDEE